MPDALLDTNVLARLVLNDIPAQRERAAAMISAAARNGDRLFVAAVTISELVFVARGAVYGRAPAGASSPSTAGSRASPGCRWRRLSIPPHGSRLPAELFAVR